MNTWNAHCELDILVLDVYGVFLCLLSLVMISKLWFPLEFSALMQDYGAY